jgi:hypothetical protein
MTVTAKNGFLVSQANNLSLFSIFYFFFLLLSLSSSLIRVLFDLLFHPSLRAAKTQLLASALRLLLPSSVLTRKSVDSNAATIFIDPPFVFGLLYAAVANCSKADFADDDHGPQQDVDAMAEQLAVEQWLASIPTNSAADSNVPATLPSCIVYYLLRHLLSSNIGSKPAYSQFDISLRSMLRIFCDDPFSHVFSFPSVWFPPSFC